MRPRNDSVNVGDAVEKHANNIVINDQDGMAVNPDGETYSTYDFSNGLVIDQSQHPTDPRVIMKREKIAQHTSPTFDSKIMED